MSEKRFAHSLFVSYRKDIPREEKIPYTAGGALTPEVLSRLVRQVLAGQVTSVQMDDESRENSLAADFREGWATVYIVRNCHDYYELVDPEAPDGEEPLNITGDGPTPRKYATDNIPLMAEVIACFARTGEPLPACTWEHTIH